MIFNLPITQSEMAAAAGVTHGAVWQWLHGHRPIPLRHCCGIERATAGRVMRWDLRPADWHLIWPELIDRPDAPPLPSPLPDLAQFAPRKRGRKPKHARACVWSPQTPAEKLAAAGIEHQGG